MKLVCKIFFFLFLLASAPVMSQDNSTDAKTEKKNDVENARIKRKKAKAEWKAKRNQERADKKAVRDHEKRLQTKATRKRMHKDQRKANRINQNKKEFFLIKLFKPKPRGGKK
ncbi:MAG TPA: hypothetical protein VII99_00850 [Bacteroidia bacterium]